MTPSQRKSLYFPAWQRCAKANSWQMVEGRLLAVPAEQLEAFAGWPDPAGPVGTEVVTTAQNLATHEHRAITAEDLRHACNHVATTGRTVSSGKLTNKEINRAVDLFNLLTDPWNLTCVAAWLNPADAERASYLSFLPKQTLDAVLRRIATNAFDTSEYEKLDIAKLRWIAGQVKHRGQPQAPKPQPYLV